VSTNEKNAKLGQKGSCGSHMTHFWNFGTPLISPGRMKLETSNLAQRCMAVSTNEKNCKIRSKGVMWGSRDPLLDFCDPLISRGRIKLETSNLAQRWTAASTNEKCKIRSKGVNEARNFKFGTEMYGSEY